MISYDPENNKRELTVPVVVGVPDPVLGGYLRPVEPQVPALGASGCIALTNNHLDMQNHLLMGTRVPSMIDPFKL
jgi:hypothetical protein